MFFFLKTKKKKKLRGIKTHLFWFTCGSFFFPPPCCCTVRVDPISCGRRGSKKTQLENSAGANHMEWKRERTGFFFLLSFLLSFLFLLALGCCSLTVCRYPPFGFSFFFSQLVRDRYDSIVRPHEVHSFRYWKDRPRRPRRPTSWKENSHHL